MADLPKVWQAGDKCEMLTFIFFPGAFQIVAGLWRYYSRQLKKLEQ